MTRRQQIVTRRKTDKAWMPCRWGSVPCRTGCVSCRKGGVPCLWGIVPFCLSLLFVSCSMIDEDLSDCGEQAEINYELELVTNVSTEISTQLTTQTDLVLAQSVRTHLGTIFSDFAHDVDLSFYDTQGDSLRLQHDEHIMNANQASYALNLPKRQYMHLATANILNNELVTLENDERCHRSMLQQAAGDTISSHTTGIFTARQPMNVLEGVDQNFNVTLYMANCAAMLVIDPRDYDASDIKVYSTGFATGFNICDSTYVYSDKSPIVTTSLIKNEDSKELGFCSVTFPSRVPRETRHVIETEEPFITQDEGESLWEFRVYVTQPDATRSWPSITETILRIRKMLHPGEFKIFRGWIGKGGGVVSKEPEVSASVTLDWKPGLVIGN